MCEELKHAVAIDEQRNPPKEPWDEYHILEVKEKYGTLRWLDNGRAEAQKVVRKYEGLSGKTCINCGKLATRISQHWISPYCDDCGPEYEEYVSIAATPDQ